MNPLQLLFLKAYQQSLVIASYSSSIVSTPNLPTPKDDLIKPLTTWFATASVICSLKSQSVLQILSIACSVFFLLLLLFLTVHNFKILLIWDSISTGLTKNSNLLSIVARLRNSARERSGNKDLSYQKIRVYWKNRILD